MKRFIAASAILALLCLGSLAQAVTIQTVSVGDLGNQPDTEVMSDGTSGYGSVAYAYKIGKYEVTAGQYAEFLNAVAGTDTYGLYSAGMASSALGCKIQRSGVWGSYTYSVASDWANRPVNYVSYWDSCRFANWIGNGQPTGLQDASTTEHGAYTLNGYNGMDASTVRRNPGSTWVVTSEKEWYKAAYYKGGGTNAGYWDYPMQSDVPTLPSNDITNPDSGNNANFSQNNGYTIGSPYYRTEVGEFENSESPYGTFDQGGNINEWNETVVWASSTNADRGLRGGSFQNLFTFLQASNRLGHTYPNSQLESIGFRLSAVPEPSSVLVLGSGILALAGMIRRRNG